MAKEQDTNQTPPDAKLAARKRHRAWVQSQIEKGLCIRCVEPASPKSKLCDGCKNKAAATRRAWRNKVGREEVVRVQREWARKQRDEGLCVHCTQPVAEGHSVCNRHLELSADKRRQNREAGLCRCGKPRANGRKRSCEKCLAKSRKGASKITQAMRDRESRGLCIHCGESAPAAGRKSCEACKRKYAEMARARVTRHLAMGLCRSCGQATPPDGTNYCEICHLKRMSAQLFGTVTRAADLKALFDAADGRCAYSNRPLTIGVNAELDHRVPESRGGTNDLSNLQWLHQMANQMKYSFPEEDFFSLIRDIAIHRLGFRD